MIQTLKEYEDAIAGQATYYVLTRFLGRGKYERVEVETVADALVEVTKRGHAGRWMIYAIAHQDHDRSKSWKQVLIATA